MIRTRAAAAAALALFATGCVHRPPPPPMPERLAAVSDLHLGDPRSLLDDDDGRALFRNVIADAVAHDGVRTLLIDGDALELSLAGESSAFGRARDLVVELATIQGLKKLVVVIGNHDHRLYEDLPGDDETKLLRVFSEGTTLHEQLAPALGPLALEVVYPDYVVTTRAGNVHFTHGHYFDHWTTPAFEGLSSFADVEARNRGWIRTITAGGEDTPTRAVYRFLYDVDQHVAGLLDAARGRPDPVQAQAHDRDLGRVFEYLAMLHDPAAIAIVAGHTHHAGGLATSVRVDDRDVAFYDVGGWVAEHTGRPMRPYLFELDVTTGESRLVPVDVPSDLERRAEDRAFSRLP